MRSAPTTGGEHDDAAAVHTVTPTPFANGPLPLWKGLNDLKPDAFRHLAILRLHLMSSDATTPVAMSAHGRRRCVAIVRPRFPPCCVEATDWSFYR